MVLNELFQMLYELNNTFQARINVKVICLFILKIVYCDTD